MSEPIRVNDWEIDPETGDILADIPRDYKAQMAAYALAEADQQIDEWKKYRAIAAAALKVNQETKIAEYGDIKVSIRQQTNRVQDVTAIKQWVLETELTRQDLLEMVIATQAGNYRAAWKVDVLPEAIRDAINDATHERSGEPFVVVEKLRKQAPRIVMPEPDLLPALEASVEAMKGIKA